MLKLDIGFFPGSVLQVHSFINEHIGQISEDNPIYHIAAATAIICENTKLPAIGSSNEKVSSGIKI